MDLNTYLYKCVDIFIGTAITRCRDTGETFHRFNLMSDQIRDATDRERLHPEVIIRFFDSFSISCTHNRQIGIYAIALDLNTCVLSPSQAEQFSAAADYNLML